uniref:ZP domain-containing protein n=1 Tax=Panagrellus redivivus TaxID=6233 RepID=A0A7E4UND9_PANRE
MIAVYKLAESCTFFISGRRLRVAMIPSFPPVFRGCPDATSESDIEYDLPLPSPAMFHNFIMPEFTKFDDEFEDFVFGKTVEFRCHFNLGITEDRTFHQSQPPTICTIPTAFPSQTSQPSLFIVDSYKFNDKKLRRTCLV